MRYKARWSTVLALVTRLAYPVRVVVFALMIGGCGPARPTNVILIVIDTVRADHLGVYGYPRPTSPEIDQWAGRGMIFERALATSAWTLPTVASILTGRLPASHGAGMRIGDTWVPSGLSSSVPTLAEQLRASGFDTGAIVANWFLKADFGVDQGFVDYDFEDDRRADRTVDRALAWVQERDGRPFFLMVHLMDPHVPYDAPKPMSGLFDTGSLPDGMPSIKEIRQHPERFGAAERAEFVNLYDEEIAFVDAQLGRFLERLEGVRETTLIVLTSDHGEEFFEHGGFEHGHALYQEVLRVPLIFWGPGVKVGSTDRPVSVVSISPTILEAVGLRPEGGAEGQSLWAWVRGMGARRLAPVFAEGTLHGVERRAVVDWPFKLLLVPETGQLELYDLSGDPRERVNLANDRPELAARLLAALNDHREHSVAQRAPDPARVEANEEMVRRLRALGYLD